ncbi:cytidylyltransferase domain-containing protein [Salidesulfovibrio onnuriiensis]|uniref:cytidylyltransferase domain-containing protein n=1 Tax=Salidesulfovibrio onnuriiensis TaxID=2583823 RepID=UPI0011C7BE6D|nr:hypothetical protein [Salidesulfovibrio onnuriiensis]
MKHCDFQPTPCLVVVQCRYNSTRLPGKALLPFGPTTMLGFLLRRLQVGLDRGGFKLVVATTMLPDDDKVAAEAVKNGAAVVRGSVDDVLARYVRCLEQYPSELIVRVTADNPFTCPRSIEAMVSLLRQSGADYARCTGYALGATADAFTAGVLMELNEKKLSGPDREHINKHILENPSSYCMVELSAQGQEARRALSVTVDTREEYERIASIVGDDESEPWNMELNETARRLDR